jgi:hypothetical protein
MEQYLPATVRHLLLAILSSTVDWLTVQARSWSYGPL